MDSVTVTIPLSERDFQRQIIEYAQLKGWRVAHFRPALTEKGWRTAVSADGAGFPDLVLVRDRVIFAEVKAKSGKATVEQTVWGEALLVAGSEYYLWRPSQWPDIQSTLDYRV